MGLEVGGGHVRMDLTLHRPSNDPGLVLPRGQERDLPGIQDGGHPHGDGLQGHVLLAEEVGGGIGPGDGVEKDQVGPGFTGRSRLVEADVAAPADAQEHEVDAARGLDGFVVVPAVTLQLVPGSGAIGDVDVLREGSPGH